MKNTGISAFVLLASIQWTGAMAAGICEPATIAAMKDTTVLDEQFTQSERIYRSFCSKERTAGVSGNFLALPAGAVFGELSGSTSTAEACLTNNRQFFVNAQSRLLLSTLPDAVQKDLVHVCGRNGLQLTAGFPKLFRTPRIGAMMHPEVRDGEASLQPRVQA